MVEASVLDGDPRGEAEGLDQCLVVAGELGPADLVGEIEVPVDLTPHLDGHAQERRHRRVVGGKAEALLVRAQVAQSQRSGIGDEQDSEDPSPGRSSPDPLLLLWLEPDGQELREGRAVLVQDAERTVAGPGHRLGFFDEVVQ